VIDPAAAESGSAGSRRITVAGLSTLALLTALIALEPLWTAPVQSFWFDFFQRHPSRTVVSTPAMVVEIDERSIAARGQWPWPRTLLRS
jgi:adenylate cyclase